VTFVCFFGVLLRRGFLLLLVPGATIAQPRILSPEPGSYVSGPYEIVWSHPDPDRVSRTELFINDVSVLAADGWVARHTHDFGEDIVRHEIWVVVTDRDGERTLSAPIQTRELRIDVSASSRVLLLTAVVKNRRSQPIVGLTQDRFSVFENGVARPIASFSNEYLPLDLVFLVDTSSSLIKENAIAQVKTAAATFVQALEKGDRVKLFEFKSRPIPLLDFTTDRKRLLDRIGQMEAIGETALFDALHRALDDLKGRRRGRKAIVLFTDGRDSVYELPRDKARLLRSGITRAQNQEVTIFIIGLGKNINQPAMERIAEETGGRFHFAANSRRLADTFDDIVLELKHQYLIGVQPQASGTGFNRLEVRVDKRGATVFARKGYTIDSE